MITSAQLRAARALLGWSANDLAVRAGVHVTTVQRMERRHEDQVRGTVSTFEKVMRVLENEGIEFDDEEGCQGVRLRELKGAGSDN